MTYVSGDYPAEFLSLFRQVGESGAPEECWLWPYGPGSAGYGRFSALGISATVHRISHFIHHGPVPEGYDVRHHCDVRLCWNPGHLTNGTRAENLHDAVVRDRMRFGVNQPNHRITADDARAIFSGYHYEGRRLRDLGDQYGLASLHTVSCIVHRETWRRATASLTLPETPLNRRAGIGSILTPEQVAEVKRRRAGQGATYAALGAEFGVSWMTARRAVLKP